MTTYRDHLRLRSQRGQPRGHATIWASAEQIALREPQHESKAPHAVRWAGAAVVAVLVATVAVALTSRGEHEVETTASDTSAPAVTATTVGSAESSATAPTTSAPASHSEALMLLPASFDARSVPLVFERQGGPEEVLGRYLLSRLPLYDSFGVDVEFLLDLDGIEIFSWEFVGDDGSAISTGFALLRSTPGGYGVVASVTAQVETRNLTVTNGVLRGAISTTSNGAMFVDVLDRTGQPVDAAVRPDGFAPDQDVLFGTMAGPVDTAAELEVPLDQEGAFVRVNLVGGTILSVTEYWIGPTPEPPAGSLCGAELPAGYEVLGGDWTVSAALPSNIEGQYAMRFGSDALVVDVRWPADEPALYGDDLLEPTSVWALGSDSDKRLIVGAIPDGVNVLTIPLSSNHDVANRCEVLELVVYENEQLVAHIGWDLRAADDESRVINLRPRVVAIAGAQEAPGEVAQCSDPAIAPIDGPPASHQSYPTPAEALASYLAGTALNTLPMAGYTETVTPDGARTYSAARSGSGDEYEAIIRVEEVAEGWAVTHVSWSGIC